jgi:hypothetical protein
MLPIEALSAQVVGTCAGQGTISRVEDENGQWVELYHLSCVGICESTGCVLQSDFLHPSILWCGCGPLGSSPNCCSLIITGATGGGATSGYGDGWGTVGGCGAGCAQQTCTAIFVPGNGQGSGGYWVKNCP